MKSQYKAIDPGGGGVASGQLWVNNSGRSTRTSKQGDSHRKFVIEEEIEFGLWGLNMWLEDLFMCNIWNVWFSETVMVPVL
jgi:hypothetical protein